MCDESVLVNTAIDVSSRDVATDLTINTHTMNVTPTSYMYVILVLYMYNVQDY